MTRYAAFLRGVNLGKRTVKSAELKAAFETMGFENVKTLLASGNVLFDARAGKGLQGKIEAGLVFQIVREKLRLDLLAKLGADGLAVVEITEMAR